MGGELESKHPCRPASRASAASSTAPPHDFSDLCCIYPCVAERRSTFDGLLCRARQTAQAFLFTTALAGDTSRAARLIAMSLSILVTILTLHLFTRQLQASHAEACWLDDFEKRHNLPFSDLAFLAQATAFTYWAAGPPGCLGSPPPALALTTFCS
ncbi:hypothetical protein JCM1841_006227 [Sporobolomyces salmonicolor]